MWRLVFHLMMAAGVASCGCGDPSLMVIAQTEDRADTPIPDEGMLERRLDVNVSGNIVRATVEVIVEHPRPDDLEAQLTSPAGTTVDLGGRLADGCDFYRYALPLLALQGEAAQGQWRLVIRDRNAGEVGRLVTSGLAFEALE